MLSSDHFVLDSFEGSLDFLICLIQKEELDLYSVSLKELLTQFHTQKEDKRDEALDNAAEFIHAIAYLIWLKSKRLLPLEATSSEEEVKIEEPRFEIIQHLIDYCRFKEAAKELVMREEEQRGCYFRGVETKEWPKPLGIDHVSLEDLSSLFREMIGKAASSNVEKIHEESWKVSDKMEMINRRLKDLDSLPFISLFSIDHSRLEMIVIFLALLELIKNGKIGISKEKEGKDILLFKRSLEEE